MVDLTNCTFDGHIYNTRRVMDECLQLFGGYGYMMEYPIAELYVDARVQRIYGGTNEIMKELASRSM
jgi:alkylation response protein AidB-like acyl-CoA dehydrogenase